MMNIGYVSGRDHVMVMSSNLKQGGRLGCLFIKIQSASCKERNTSPPNLERRRLRKYTP
jgi:hypothetical protein